MTDLNLDQLQQVAEEATKGPWSGGRTGILHGAEWVVWNDPGDNGFIMLEQDATFIATFNPARVLQLLQALRDAKTEAYEEAATFVRQTPNRLIMEMGLRVPDGFMNTVQLIAYELEKHAQRTAGGLK